MYTGLLHTHSLLRYLVLIFLLIVIVNSFLGFSGKKSFGKLDNGLSLTLFSVTHTQFLVGILLYFVSPFVQISGAAMKDPSLRYWTMEHNVMMLIAIAIITAGRTTMKKMTEGRAKHKRLFIFNSIALVIIIVTIAMSKRGFFGLPG